MKQYQSVIMLVLGCTVIFSCVANEAVQSAAKTASEEVTGGKLGKLYKTRDQAESAEQKEMIIKACVAGLYAIGDVKNAVKIKTDLNDRDFVSSFMVECDKCEGIGNVSQKCYKCKGTGKCQNRKCNEGMVTSPGFDGQSTTRKCSTCGGTGACKNCRGSGEVSSTCAKCRGSKNVIQRDEAMDVCKALLKTLSMPDKEVGTRDEADMLVQGKRKRSENHGQKKTDNSAATAKFGLGLCCYEGSAQVPQDKVTAAKLFREAAELGHVKAQFMLGTCYYNGEGVTQDKSEAARWCRKAAEQGDAEAQYYYGMMCSDGVGVPKDEKEAVNWYRRAAEQEYAEAQFNLGCCYRNGTGISQDKAEAAKWYSRAAEHGYSKAQLNLGNLYSNGEGVAKNDAEAVAWYRKAAEQGNAEAQFNLGLRYTIGAGVPVDPKEAIRCYRKSADQGYYKAQFNLGLFYFYGQGVNQDKDEAIKLFREAAKQGHQKAKDFLRKIGQDEEGACQRRGTSRSRTYEFKIGGFSDLGNSTFRESMGIDAENVSQYFDKQRKDTVYRYVAKDFEEKDSYRVAKINTATEQSKKIVETIDCWTFFTKTRVEKEIATKIFGDIKAVALLGKNKIVATSLNANCCDMSEEELVKVLSTAYVKLLGAGHGSFGIQWKESNGVYVSWQCAVGTKDDGIFVIEALTTSDILIRDDMYGNKE